MEKLKYSSLNGLRAISISLVIIAHLNNRELILKGLIDIKLLRPLFYFLQDGHWGVYVFFVLSGFLITSLLLNEEIQTSTVSLKNFYIRRTLRIFPAYYFLLLVYLILQVAGFISLDTSSWITSFTYTKFLNWNLDWITSHAWSLSIEEQFYIFWPIFFISGPKIRKNLVLLFIAIVPILRIFLYFHKISWIDDLSIFTNIDVIATGCFIAIYQKEIVESLSSYWKTIFYISILSIICFNVLNILVAKIHFAVLFILFSTLLRTVANFLIGVIMLYSVFGPKGPWFRFLNLKAVNYIGLLSYSTYLWQQIFISGENLWVSKLPQNLLCILIMTLFSYYIIERPFQKLKSKFSKH